MKISKIMKITGIGNYFPKKILTNNDLEKMIDTSDEWITTRTGIKQRRIAAEDESTSAMAAKAARKAIKGAGLKPSDIELIMVATITPDMNFPSTACLVQAEIKAFNAASLDIGAACSGYVYGLSIARAYIASGVYKNILLIGAEKLTSITDWTDRNTCVLFGDGAGACVLQPGYTNSGIQSILLGSDGRKGGLLYIPAGGSKMPSNQQTVNEHLHFIKMKGSELFKVAVTKMTEAAVGALEMCGMTPDDIDMLVPHQANIRIIRAVGKKLKLSDERVYTNIEHYGNMSSASIATALNEAVIKGRIRKGNIAVLTAFGGGLTWGACVIKW